ncbi:SusE domain-containing protein [Flavobacterium azooxidireducens]|uniref:SusE domain-containing protein n=1 Tax=Flavobacterium azooxidireducens TaxID=1871076 RepID=A0ABY4KDF4_9FLAO|nr:SusE domain-containing protein [Flavobacterium azooxidireducens]UPQ77783.1 SusE domain-containing protein [Flavobacterium azooxidireducens]
MKKILKSLSFASLFLIAVSCENDDFSVATATGGPELLTPESGNEYNLSPENPESEATTFVWNHADYDVQTEVNYVLQFALAGTEFAAVSEIGPSTQRFRKVTVAEMNAAMLEIEAEPFVLTNVDVRVKAYLGSNESMPLYSNVISISVTPFTLDLPLLWIPGSYQAESGYGSDNWSHALAPSLAASAYGKTDFEGYVYFANNVIADNDNGFKFSTQQNWDGTNYGDDGSFSGILSSTGSNIGVQAGFYRVRANTGEVTEANPNGLTYSTVQVSWGIIGAATPTGWDSDTDLVYNPTTKKLEIASIALVPGGFKFRGNNAWDNGFDLGTVDEDGFLQPSGDLTFDGPEGNYKVVLDLSNPRQYTYELIAL